MTVQHAKIINICIKYLNVINYFKKEFINLRRKETDKQSFRNDPLIPLSTLTLLLTHIKALI